MKFDNTDYFEILFSSIEVDTVFAYIATMIAPFLFVFGTTKKIKYGRFLLFLSISITAIISSRYSEYKIESKRSNAGYVAKTAYQSSRTKTSPIEINPPKRVSSETNNAPGVIVSNSLSNSLKCLDFNMKILLGCYIVSLLIWYYSIYLRYLEAPDIQEGEVKRVKNLMDVISEQTRGQNGD
jgi:hypothetical protein